MCSKLDPRDKKIKRHKDKRWGFFIMSTPTLEKHSTKTQDYPFNDVTYEVILLLIKYLKWTAL